MELGRVLTGEDEFCSLTKLSEQSGFSGLFSGSLEADLDLVASCSINELAGSFCSLLSSGSGVSACRSEELPI